MRRLLSVVAIFATLQSTAQQINPVPDYVFRNQMSVGRNAVTDTAAYFSIGPRYGANKGFMPPIVGDTATFSSGKRNGLLIFSVQKNKFLYWDSVRVQWSDMAGSSGSYIVAGDTAAMLAPYLRKADTSSMLTAYLRKADTSSMLSPYIRHAGYGLTKSGQSFIVDTLNIATRAWRQKGIDSTLAASVLLTTNQTVNGNKTFTNDITFNGTTYNRVMSVLNISAPAYNHIIYSKANAVNQFIYLPADTGTLITDKTLQSFVSGTTNYVPKFTAGSTIGNSQIFDNGTRVGIGTASPAAKIDVRGTGTQDVYLISTTATNVENSLQSYFNNGGAWADLSTKSQNLIFNTGPSGGPQAERLRITSDGNVGIGATGSLLPLTVYNPTLNTPVLEVRGGGGSSQTRINLSYGNTTSTTLNGDIFASTTDFALRAQAGRNMWFGTDAVSGSTNRMQIFANGRVGINTTTDAGYQLDINGTIRSVNGANFATTSGSVGIGTTSPNQKITIQSGVGDVAGITMRANGLTSSDEVFIGQGSAGSLFLTNRSTNAITFQTGGFTRMNLTNDAELFINTTSDAGDYKLQVSGNIYNTGSITTGAPSGGSIKPWKIGEAATVSPTSPNRTIRVEIDGVVYYLHAKTTND